MSDRDRLEANSIPRVPPAWAAYVAGHHGPMFGLWLDGAWEEVTLGMPAQPGRLALRPGFGEMNTALRVLAVAGAAEGPALVEVHRAVDAVQLCSCRLLRARRASDHDRVRRAFVRGQRWVDVLLDLGAVLLQPSAGSADWFALGAAVGRCRRTCRAAAASGDYPSGMLDGVRVAAGRLRSAPEGAALEPLQKLAEPEPDVADDALAGARCSHLLYLALARADAAVRSTLRGAEAPRPVLALDAERLVFFGLEVRLRDLPTTQTAALWVLAENAGRPVPRATIRREGRIQTPEERMEEVISRLRGELRRLADRLGPGAHPGPEAARRLIRGLSGEHPHQGPYKLDVAPERVQVSPPRPAWMRHP